MLIVVLVLSCLAGFSTRRGTICLVRASQEIIAKKPPKTIIFILQAITVSLSITVPAMMFFPEHVVPAISYQISISLFWGAVIYGLGSAINGGCAFGTLNYLINGNLNYLGTFVGLFIGYFIYLNYPEIVPLNNPVKDTSVENHIIYLGTLVIISWGFVIWRTKRFFNSTFKTLYKRYNDYLRSPVARDFIAILILGLSSGSLYILIGHSWNHTQFILSSGQLIFNVTPNINNFYTVTATTIGFIGGIILATYLSKSFKAIPITPAKLLRRMIGGILMSIGAIFIPGGNDTLILYDM